MADIYLSYKREDRDRAQLVERALRAQGWDVFWDHDLLPSTVPFREAIAQELDRARCVLVLWSHSSVESEWVLDEATQGKESDKLICARIDNVKMPFGFRQLQTADLSDWNGDETAPAFQLLVQGIAQHVRRSAYAPSPAYEHPSVYGVLPDDEPLPSPPPLSPARPEPALPFSLRLRRLVFAIRYAFGRWPVAAGPKPAFSSEPVLLGVAAPRRAAPGSHFTAHFTAYIQERREAVRRALLDLGEADARVALDIPPSGQARWLVGAPVTVRLTGEHLVFTPEQQSFEWNGRHNLVSFDVRVRDDAPQPSIGLCFHVLLDTVPIAFIPVQLTIAAAHTAARTEEDPHRVEVRTPSSAFASYSSQDAELVAPRLSTLAHWDPGLEIFQDCLDLTPNESFKPRLQEEILRRDVFLLFWSRNAAASPWVDWEYQTARTQKGLDAILPMLLEDPAIAKPPPEFAERHLRDRFMIAGYGLKKIRELAGDSKRPGQDAS